MKKKVLIVNADDFGLNESITDAIIETHINGIVTSTTIMVNMPGFEYAVKRSKDITSLGVGIHFNLTEGQPISDITKIPLLLNEYGHFKNNEVQRKNLFFGSEKLKQVKIELGAQLVKLLDYGIHPTHFDSHHHITGLPVSFRASIEVASNYRVNKARITSINYHFAPNTLFAQKLKVLPKIIRSKPKALVHLYNKSRLRQAGFQTPDDKILPSRVLLNKIDYIEHFISTLAVIKPGITEISFHPGYKDSYSNDNQHFSQLRLMDYNMATNRKVIEYISKNKIELSNFYKAFHG